MLEALPFCVKESRRAIRITNTAAIWMQWSAIPKAPNVCKKNLDKPFVFTLKQKLQIKCPLSNGAVYLPFNALMQFYLFAMFILFGDFLTFMFLQKD